MELRMVVVIILYIYNYLGIRMSFTIESGFIQCFHAGDVKSSEDRRKNHEQDTKH